MTDLADATITSPSTRPRVVPTLLFGLLGGSVLGVVARAWMRLISVDPEFSWNGTMFIIIGFTFFGAAQAVCAVVTRRSSRRWLVRLGRAVGIVGLLPLFVAAGSVMAPTVIAGGMAASRHGWPLVARAVCLVVAAVPVVFVTSDLVDAFGWSVHALAGVAGLLAIYATIIVLAGATFAPSRVSRPWNVWVTLGMVVVAGGRFGFLLIGAGG
jgi:hypothetical protein